MDIIKREPVRFWAAVTAVFEALFPALILFGVLSWDAEQLAAVMLVIAAIGGLFAFFFVREKVTPV